MATATKTVFRRAKQVKEVRKLFGKLCSVRKGSHYIGAQCDGCKRIFQIPYRVASYEWAIRQLSNHLRVCPRL